MIYADFESILRHEDNKIQNANVSYTKKNIKITLLVVQLWLQISVRW